MTRTRRPRGSLSPEAILDAAERLASARGFEALTMRAVAGELEAAPMALYRHFAMKDELVNALLDRVLGRFDPPASTGDWAEDLRAFANAHRRLLAGHPWALAPLFTHPNPGRNAVRIGEHALEILHRAGFPAERAVATFSGIIALNYGWSSFAAARYAESSEAEEQVRGALEAILPAEFPRTAGVAGEMGDYGSDRHYDLVLDQTLAGIRGATP